ncbi:MAG: hypothetical protein RLZZ381_3057 [Cyanobacteriota bacterium]|jgi:hypothetical protein
MTTLQSQKRQVFSSSILRLVGYGLLLLAVVDLLLLRMPAQTYPLSQLQTMGAFIERTPFTLLAIVLIFSGPKSDRSFIEVILLKVFSWVSLIAAVVLILVIPLNINNSWRIYNQHDATTDAQFMRQRDNLQQFQQQLAAADSKNEIAAILQQQARQTVNIPESANLQKLKTDIIANLQNHQDNITSQIEVFRAQKSSLLLKQCLKWNLGASIASILFFMIWKSTKWARLMLIN